MTPASEPDADACLQVGQYWLGRYQIERELAASGGGMIFAGTRLEDGVSVRLRQLAGSADSESRRQVWQLLSEPPMTSGPRLLETVPTDDGRVEIWQHLDGPTLEERLATAKLVTEDVAELVRPLAQGLAELHDRGVCYLQLGAERVILPESLMGEAQLTRIEMCMPLGGSGLIAVPTDPTRMPPEAAGLFRLPADEGLKAWDWWTLGRLIQELWLGHTVMAHALGRDYPRASEMVRREADKLLKEADAKDTRAGGVELMTDLPVQIRTLLRGLLTSVRDARWGAREVLAWLDGETPSERYGMSRSTVLIRFHDHHLTVAETAACLLTPEHWKEGVEIWGAATAAEGSILDVLAKTLNALHVEREWVEKVRELAGTRAGKDMAKPVRDEIMSALAWTGLAGKGASLRWRGQPIESNTMTRILEEPDGRERVLALLNRAVITLLKTVDADAAWALDTWAGKVEQVQALAAKHEWVGKNPANANRLLALALADNATLDRLYCAARGKYRMSTVETVQTMFGAMNPPFAMLAVLALSFENAKVCGYLTLEEWRALELGRLRARGAKLVEALAAMKLAETLRMGLPVFGGEWPLRVAGVFLIGLTVLAWPGWVGLGTVLGLGCGLTVLRRLLRPIVARELGFEETPTENAPVVPADKAAERTKAKSVPPVGAKVAPGKPAKKETKRVWSWHGAVGACADRARVALEGGSVLPARELKARLDLLNQEIVKLGITPAPDPVPEPGVDERLVGAGWGAWGLVALIVAALSWQALQPEWNMQWVGGEWRRELGGLAVQFGLTEPEPEEIPVVKIAWPHKQTEDGRGVTVLGRDPSTAEQRAVVTAFAAEIQRLYLPETLSGVVAVSVPVPEGSGLMLLDVVSGKQVDGLVYRMAYTPFRGTWMKVGAGPDVLYLNSP